MKTYKLHYETQTGKILGYYPCDIAYDVVPSPHITITEKEYEKALYNESKFRVQNRALVDISDSAEYQVESLSKLKIQILEKINNLALSAKAHGVLLVDEMYYINVEWKDYYSTMMNLNFKNFSDIKLKTYQRLGNSYQVEWKEFPVKDAKAFLKKVTSAIAEYCNVYVPEKQIQYMERYKELEQTDKIADLLNFLNEIDYGFTAEEN